MDYRMEMQCYIPSHECYRAVLEACERYSINYETAMHVCQKLKYPKGRVYHESMFGPGPDIVYFDYIESDKTRALVADIERFYQPEPTPDYDRANAAITPPVASTKAAWWRIW